MALGWQTAFKTNELTHIIEFSVETKTTTGKHHNYNIKPASEWVRSAVSLLICCWQMNENLLPVSHINRSFLHGWNVYYFIFERNNGQKKWFGRGMFGWNDQFKRKPMWLVNNVFITRSAKAYETANSIFCCLDILCVSISITRLSK